MTTTMNTKDYLKALEWRYACKKFDPSYKIDPAVWRAIEETFRLSPSSLGLEPWHFIVVDSPSVRERLCEASFGQTQARDASRYVVLCGRRDIDDADLLAHIECIHETRRTTPEEDAAHLAKYRGYAAFWKNGRADAYIESQIHLCAGFVANGAAQLGVDTCILGGIQPAEYDAILGLETGRYRSMLGMAFGRRSPEDDYAGAAKARFPMERVFSRI